MKNFARIFGVHTVLGVIAAIMFVAFVVCNHNETENAVKTQIDELVTNAVYRATAEFAVDHQSVSWMAYPVFERKLGVDWDETPYANIVAAPTFDPKFWVKKEVERKYAAAL